MDDFVDPAIYSYMHNKEDDKMIHKEGDQDINCSWHNGLNTDKMIKFKDGDKVDISALHDSGSAVFIYKEGCEPVIKSDENKMNHDFYGLIDAMKFQYNRRNPMIDVGKYLNSIEYNQENRNIHAAVCNEICNAEQYADQLLKENLGKLNEFVENTNET